MTGLGTVADWVTQAGMVAGGLTAVLSVLAVLWRVLRRLVHLQDVLERVEARSAELEHNGGSSLRDAVTRIEARVDELAHRLDDHLGVRR